MSDTPVPQPTDPVLAALAIIDEVADLPGSSRMSLATARVLAGEVKRLRRIETLARAAVQPNGRMLSIDTNALKALMEAARG